MHPDADALNRIAERDPDSGETEPTPAARAAHKRWAIDTYGEQVWATYTGTPWGLFGLDVV